MNRRALLAALAVLGSVLGSALPAAAQSWTQQSSLPTGWDLSGVTFLSPTHGFICGEDMVLMETTDGGASWNQVPSVPRDPAFVETQLYAMAFADAQHGWAVGHLNYRTTDGGASWMRMDSAGSNNEQIIPVSSQVAYLNSVFVIQKTTDGGASWFVIYPESEWDRVYAMDWWDADRGVFWGGGTGGSVNGLRATFDGGETWELRRSGMADDVTFLASDVLLWHNGGGRTVFRSVDLGQTATAVLTVVEEPVEVIHRLPGGRILVVDAAVRMWISDDDGFSWTQVRDKLGKRGLQHPAVHFRDSQNGWFVSEDGLMLQTADGGSTWTQRQSGIGAFLESITMYPDGRGIAAGENGAVIVTDDFGGQWTLRPILEGPDGVVWDLADLSPAGTGSRVFIASEPGLVFRSEDRGDTWTALPNSPYFPNSIMHVLDFTDEQTGYMFGRSYDFGLVYRTTDGGETWETMMEAGDREPLQLDAEMFDASNGVSVGSSGRFFFTTDGWQTWTRRNITANGVAWESIGFADLQYGWVGSFYGSVARTTDGGVSWTDVFLPGISEDYKIRAIDAKSRSEVRMLAAGVDDIRIYESFNGGQSWQISDPGIANEDFWPTFTFNFFVSDAGDIWTVGNLGFLLARRDQTVAVGDGGEGRDGLRVAPRLHSAVPNPFRPATTIGFTLPAANRVRLSIHDVSGRTVAALVDGTVEAGAHRVRWDGRDAQGRELPAGMFLARLAWDGGSETTKLLLVR